MKHGALIYGGTLLCNSVHSVVVHVTVPVFTCLILKVGHQPATKLQIPQTEMHPCLSERGMSGLESQGFSPQRSPPGSNAPSDTGGPGIV